MKVVVPFKEIEVWFDDKNIKPHVAWEIYITQSLFYVWLQRTTALDKTLKVM